MEEDNNLNNNHKENSDSKIIYKPLPQNVSDEKKKSFFGLSWKKNEVKNLNEILKENKIKYRVFNINFLVVSVFLLILILTIGVSSFIYFGFNDFFKSTFTDNSVCTNSCPAIPACPGCSLDCGMQNITVKMPNSVILNIDDINSTKYNNTCLSSCLI